jgi:P63C domain
MDEQTERQSENANRASKGGAARMSKLTLEERKKLASLAAKARWGKARKDPGETASQGYPAIVLSSENTSLPVARWPGVLTVGDIEIPVYVLEDRRRIISRTGATTVLTGGKGGGNLESYVQVRTLERFIPPNLLDRMIDFSIPEVVNKSVRGMDADIFLEICGGYVRALEAGALESAVQVAIAARASVFLAACSRVGLVALIDEATGYQYRRAEEELQLKLKLFLEEEMRKWEKTFPNELWEQFGRLTNWKGAVHQRPKYWGNLVMELIYEYLDQDVAQWLRENAPKPRHGQNYHQWLTSQYGLKKLIEHIWKVIGIASTCQDMAELRHQMEKLYGTKPGFQYELRMVPVAPQPLGLNR